MTAPNSLPDRDRLRAARALHLWWGIDRVRLAEAGFRFSQEHLSAPEYDPIDDQVAIDRAFAGDRAVFANLTHYEKQKVRQKVRNVLDGPQRELEGNGGPITLADWCRMVGETENVVRGFLRRARIKDRAAAARG